jgi:hypothetical protein
MKNIITLSTLALFAMSTAFGQDFPKVDASPLDVSYYPANATKAIFAKTEAEKKALKPMARIIYSRPQKKDRVIFGNLIEYGTAWRIGANEATEIEFMTDVKFGDKTVKAGKYTLLATPNEKEWTVTLNSVIYQWGVYAHDPKKDIASVTVPVQKSEEVIEALSIAMYEKNDNVFHIKIGWDKTFVEVPVTLK